MHRSRIFAPLLAVVAICIPAAPQAGAQGASSAVPRKSASEPAARPPATRPVQVGRDTTVARKSLSERLFEARWVVFPARFAIISVCLSLGLVLLICGTWGAVRVAHSLLHTKWQEPPRRLKRGEIGAAGTSLGVEWEERLSTNTENDRQQDAQITWLEEGFNRVTRDVNTLAARVTTLEISTGVRSHERTDGAG